MGNRERAHGFTACRVGWTLTGAELVALVDRLCRGVWIAGMDDDDVRQVAAVAALEALPDFDPGRGVDVEGFLSVVIRRKVATAIRDAGRRKRAILDLSARVVRDGDGNLVELVDMLEAPGPDVVELVDARARLDRLRRAAATLTPLEREALAAAVNGDPFYWTSRRLDNAAQRARRKLRAA